MSLLVRKINVSLTLSDGTTFGGAGGGSAVQNLTGLRVRAHIVKVGGEAFNTLDARIYGMTLSSMNALSTVGNVISNGRNSVTMTAGDDVSGMSQVFAGYINNAYADMNAMPDVAFQILGSGELKSAMTTVPPTTFKGAKSAADVISGLAGQAGLKFENNGVNTILSNPYFPGTVREQMLACVKAAGCEWSGVDNGVVSIWPPGGSRVGGDSITVSPSTGMIGYPAFTNNGVMVRTLFNPSVKFGQTFSVQSDIKKANGTWNMFTLEYHIESQTPNGAWFMTMTGAKQGQPGVAGTT
jgi:hypothetical protein